VQSAEKLEQMLRAHFDSIGGEYQAEFRLSAEPFVTPKGYFTDLVSDAVHMMTGRIPVLSTSGGTSDARFFAPYTDVVEFGLVGKTMHKIDEAVALSDLTKLTRIYQQILSAYFDVSA
jgi:succinyl-diaminopimelate desuccinylase